MRVPKSIFPAKPPACRPAESNLCRRRHGPSVLCAAQKYMRVHFLILIKQNLFAHRRRMRINKFCLSRSHSSSLSRSRLASPLWVASDYAKWTVLCLLIHLFLTACILSHRKSPVSVLLHAARFFNNVSTYLAEAQEIWNILLHGSNFSVKNFMLPRW